MWRLRIVVELLSCFRLELALIDLVRLCLHNGAPRVGRVIDLLEECRSLVHKYAREKSESLRTSLKRARE